MATKVLVVDDSMMMRKLVKDIVSADSDMEVVGDAANGEVALAKAKDMKPDVILLDIEMPVMDGLDFMKHYKLIGKAKIIVLSSVTAAGSATATEARKLGALEIINKPSGGISLDLQAKKGHEIVKSIRKVAGI